MPLATKKQTPKQGQKNREPLNLTKGVKYDIIKRAVFRYATCSLLLVLAITFTACKNPAAPDPCASGHDWGEWAETTSATCTEAGTQERICNRNTAHTETRDNPDAPIDPAAHDMQWVSTATETTDGEETYICQVCGHTDDGPRTAYATGTAGLSYTLISGNTEYSVSAGTVTSGAVFIPAFHRGANGAYLPVTAIANDAFLSQDLITSVTIAASVKTIDHRAFSSCIELASVTFAEGSVLETIGISAFEDSVITNITIPASVKTIYYDAFNHCGNLESVTFATGSQLETIGSRAFKYSGLRSITVPAGVTAIYDEAFMYCYRLQTVIFEGDLFDTIFWETFRDCARLESIVIPASIEYVLEDTFLGCDRLETVFYGGADEAAWNLIYIRDNNDTLKDAPNRYYYSETEPTGEGDFWRYEDGVPTVWE